MTTAEPGRAQKSPPPPGTGQSPSGTGQDPLSPGQAEPAATPTLRALTVPGITLVIAVLLLAGGALMRVPESAGYLGPDFFPLTVGAVLLLTALASGARMAWTSRKAGEGPNGTASRPQAPATGEQETTAPSEAGDWRTVSLMAATLTAHVLLLQPLGWLIAGTLLFWGISFALDRNKPLMDLFVAVALSALVQMCFSGLLDVALPLGVLGKVL